MPRGKKEQSKIRTNSSDNIFDDLTDKKITSIQKKINSKPRQKTRVLNTKSTALQKNDLILHLPFDSTLYRCTKYAVFETKSETIIW